MAEVRYPRDLRGYGRTPPHPRWPGEARVAVQFVVNFEEGGENNILHGDKASEAFLSDVLGAQPWPGNIRQLRQVLERTLLLAGKAQLDAADFRADEKLRGDERIAGVSPSGFGGHGMTLEQAERQMIEQVLAQHEGNISRVAKALGLSRAALYRRLEKHGLATGADDA